MIRTKNKINFDRGKWEIRCKIPKGDGFWCAFWGSGGDEIDVFETNSDQPGRLNQEIHTEYRDDSKGIKPVNTTADFRTLGFDYSADFHTYSIVWDIMYVSWLIDGTEVKRVWGYWDIIAGKKVNTTYLYKGERFRKFDYFPTASQCIIANFAISADGVFGTTSSSTPSEAKFIIDYIRVYQRANNIQSGYEDLCDFKLKPIELLCSSNSQTISINANVNNFTNWAASNASMSNTSSANTAFTPKANGLINIEAMAKEYCNTKNVVEFWYGKPKHIIKVAPIPCSKCWKITFDNLEIMEAAPIWDIGTTIKYYPEDCTGTTTFSIPATLTSKNTCGTYNYSSTIKSINTNCTGGNTGTQFAIPISNELRMETVMDKLGIVNQPDESTKIILYNMSNYTSLELNQNQVILDEITESKGLYVIYFLNQNKGLQSYIKLIRF